MATLQDIISDNKTFSRSQLKSDKTLVRLIQIRLRNLGLYPGGQWIDGDLGSGDTFTWRGLKNFCQASALTGLPSETAAINPEMAKKLIDTRQLSTVLDQAKNTSSILKKLKDIQDNSLVAANIGVTHAFVARTLTNSPFASEVDDYPGHLAQKPDGVKLVSYGETFTLAGTGDLVTFTDYPNRGKLPKIDHSGLNFLPNNISHACLCVGSFEDSTSPIKTHWLGKDSLSSQQFLSSTKFIGVLNAIEQINSKFPDVDVDNCVIKSPRRKFLDLLTDMVSYRQDAKGNFGRSNQIGVLFKRFTKREDLEKWLRARTGDSNSQFRGGYGASPLISNPRIEDLTRTGNKVVLEASSSTGATGNNLISAYDLVRLITMLGWHLHLTSDSRFVGSQWKSLETLVRAMGTDPARYVDVALETLGVINLISEPVVLSKAGFGKSSFTYVAFVKFVDNRATPAKLRTFSFALRTPNGSNKTRDTNMAAAVTEIIRRVLTEELA